MFRPTPTRLLVAFAVLLASVRPAGAQQPVSIRAVDPSTFANVFFGDDTNKAIRVVQIGGTQSPSVYWTIRFTDGNNYLTPSLDYTHDTALTMASTAGPVIMGRASSVRPTAVTADTKAVASWRTRDGMSVDAMGASDAAGLAASECVITSAASDNATNCKASAGNWYGYDLLNVTTTIYYLRLYNLATTPTCSSATGFIRSIPIPPAPLSGQAGGAIRFFTIPVQYSAGIGYCLTSGSSSTDDVSAAAGVFGAMLIK